MRAGAGALSVDWRGAARQGADHNPDPGYLRSEALAGRSPAADLRDLRDAVPSVQRRDVAAGRSAVTMRAGHFANLIIAACIVVPQCVVAVLSPWVGRAAQTMGRKRLLLLGWGALPLRGLLLAVLPGAWPLVMGQAVSGISAAVFGVLLPLLAADLTLGTAHFNLCMGMLGLALYLGAAIARPCRVASPTMPACGGLPRPGRHWPAGLRAWSGWPCPRHGQPRLRLIRQFGNDPQRLVAADHPLAVVEGVAEAGVPIVPGRAGEMRGQHYV